MDDKSLCQSIPHLKSLHIRQLQRKFGRVPSIKRNQTMIVCSFHFESPLFILRFSFKFVGTPQSNLTLLISGAFLSVQSMSILDLGPYSSMPKGCSTKCTSKSRKNKQAQKPGILFLQIYVERSDKCCS